MDKIATSATCENIPIDNPKRIDILLNFTNEQFSKLIKGLIPHQMEDKWFIFYENSWLYFHRSWTGYGNYKAQIIKKQNGYYIDALWAERNIEKYKNQDDETDIKTFTFLIERGLLGIDVREMYNEKGIKSEEDSIKEWSSLGNLLFTNQGIDYTDKIKSVLFGVAIGDAIGVPVEFNKRHIIRQKPIKDMVGYGTHNLPPGTWSDDSSLTFCLSEALTLDFDLNIIGQNFVNWCYKNYWTATGNVFDIGIATKQAIDRLAKGVKPELAGGIDISSNGNGSLMRILPLLFYLFDKPINERFELTKQVSSITHGHIRSVIACFYYLEFARYLLEEKNKFEIYSTLKTEIPNYLVSLSINQTEIAIFDRLLNADIYDLKVEEISSTGYVLHTLEASIWCLLTTDNYKKAVLKAINLGDDTDTTGAVTGGLAGLLYGKENIPKKWVEQVARHNDIEELAVRLGKRISGL